MSINLCSQSKPLSHEEYIPHNQVVSCGLFAAYSELPAFLTKNGGLNSGFMMVQCTAAALGQLHRKPPDGASRTARRRYTSHLQLSLALLCPFYVMYLRMLPIHNNH